MHKSKSHCNCCERDVVYQKIIRPVNTELNSGPSVIVYRGCPKCSAPDNFNIGKKED